jgi:hypothetical protein
LEAATALIAANEFDTFPCVSHFLEHAAKSHRGEPDRIFDLLQRLMEAIQSGRVDPLKARLSIGVAITAITVEFERVLPGLDEFTVATLPTLDEPHMWFATQIMAQRKVLSDNTTNLVFQALARGAVGTISRKRFAWRVGLLRELLRLPIITPESMYAFVSPILEAKLGIFFGRAPEKCSGVPPILYGFLADVINKLPTYPEARRIPETLVAWLDAGIVEPMPLLEPIIAALTHNLFDLTLARDFVPIAKRLLANDNNDLAIVTDVLVKLFEQAPESLELFVDLIELYRPHVHSAAIGIEKVIDAMPQVFQLLVNICEHAVDVKVDEGLFSDLLCLLPFPPKVSEQERIFHGLMHLFDTREQFKCLRERFACVLGELLLGKQSELALSSELIASLKTRLQNMLREDEKLKSSLMERFKTSEETINRFQDLIGT